MIAAVVLVLVGLLCTSDLEYRLSDSAAKCIALGMVVVGALTLFGLLP